MTIIRRLLLALAIVACGVSIPATIHGQVIPQKRLRLFLDCATRCDHQYLRTEVTMVDWVTDRGASDIHVIATGLATGSGGREISFEFIGRGTLDGLADQHTFATSPNDTDDDRRVEFARVLRLGLVRYLLVSDQAQALVVMSGDSTGEGVDEELKVDPWNYWVFNANTNGNVNAVSGRTAYHLGMQLNANRVTDEWKVDLEFGASTDRTEFDLDDGETFTATREGWKVEALVAKSLGPQWSIGLDGEALNWAPANIDLLVRISPAIEVDLIPYSEAHRLRMIVQYTLGVTHRNYVEETVFDKLKETKVDHRLRVAYWTRQPWGSANLTASFTAFADDLSQNRFGIGGGIGIRVAKGLNINIGSSYSKVKNQISIPKGDATDEEIFLQLRQRATDFEAKVNLGVSYTFGSFLNNIVNPRLGNLQ